jgi:hypothetical protein
MQNPPLAQIVNPEPAPPSLVPSLVAQWQPSAMVLGLSDWPWA